MKVRLISALVALVATGCAQPPPVPGLLQLEVLRGFGAVPRPSTEPERVELLLDLTASMKETTLAGPRRESAARSAASRFVTALDAEATLRVHTLGAGSESLCDAVLAAPPSQARADALDWIRRAGAGGESSLADALEDLGERALRGDAPGRPRLIAFTDLGGQCGGDVCAAADQLATRGVRLDLVVIGDALVPECLRDYREVQATGPPPGADLAAAPRFHIETTALGAPAAVAWGEAGGVPVRIEPGAVTVVIEFDPPLRVERTIAPGDRWLLQVLEFPAIEPWARRWRWSRLPDPPPSAGQALQ